MTDRRDHPIRLHVTGAPDPEAIRRALRSDRYRPRQAPPEPVPADRLGLAVALLVIAAFIVVVLVVRTPGPPGPEPCGRVADAVCFDGELGP